MCHYFLVSPILEARAKILQKMFTFWEIWRHQNFILRLTDLYMLCKSSHSCRPINQSKKKNKKKYMHQCFCCFKICNSVKLHGMNKLIKTLQIRGEYSTTEPIIIPTLEAPDPLTIMVLTWSLSGQTLTLVSYLVEAPSPCKRK